MRAWGTSSSGSAGPTLGKGWRRISRSEPPTSPGPPANDHREGDASMSLDGSVALVTGAARGIGAAIAHRLADAGATVVVADLDGDAAASTAGTLAGKAIGVAIDVSS